MWITRVPGKLGKRPSESENSLSRTLFTLGRVLLRSEPLSVSLICFKGTFELDHLNNCVQFVLFLG